MSAYWWSLWGIGHRLENFGLFPVLEPRGNHVFRMPRKDVLGKIDSNCENAHGFPLSSFIKWMT